MAENEHINWNSLEEVDPSLIPIEIELSTKCSVSCPCCPRHQQWDIRNTWNTGFIDKNVAINLIKNTNYKAYNLVGAYGDSIYHPDFHEIVNTLLQERKHSLIETNGSHRSTEWWDRVADLPWHYTSKSSPIGRNINHIDFRFSIDGLADTNHIYRRNSKWETIIYAINKLSSLPIGNRPHLSWKYLVFPYNEHQVDEARKLANEMGFDQFMPVKSVREYKDKWFNNDTEYRKQIDWTVS